MASVRLFLFLVLQICILKQTLSEYEIILERIETLLGDEDQFFKLLDLRVRRANKTQYVLNGTYILKKPIGNNHIAGFKAYNLAGGQWKMLFGRIVGPVCDNFYEDHMRKPVEEFAASTNVTYWQWGMCPFRNDYIMIRNYFPTSLGDHLPPYIPGGERWKLSVYVTDANDTETILGGCSIYAILRSEYSLLRYGG